MKAPVSVTLAAVTDPEVAASQRSVLATLPLSLVEGGLRSPLAVVDGGSSDWPETAVNLLRAGMRGLFIDRPTVKTSPDAMRAFADKADATGVAVAVNGTWCSVAAVSALARAVRERDGVRLIDSLVEFPRDFAPDRAELTLEQVMIVEAVAGAIDTVDTSSAATDGYTIVARRGIASAVLCGIRSVSGPPRLDVFVHAPEMSGHLELVRDAPARPARLRIVDPSGRKSWPARSESADRTTWRRILRAVSVGARLNDLGHLADGIEHTILLTAGWSEVTMSPSRSAQRQRPQPSRGA